MMRLLSIVLCFIFVVMSESFGEVYFVLPDKSVLEDVNKGMKKKTMNRDYNVLDQMNNQYKGKLKYRPKGAGIKSYKKGKFYVGVYFSRIGIEVDEIERTDLIDPSSGEQGTYKVKSGNFGDSYGASVGVYFNKNMALEIEYFDYKDDIKTNEPIFGTYSRVYDTVEMNVRNYFLNYVIENNFSRVIPLMGVGIGVVVADFNNDLVNSIGSATNRARIEDGDIGMAYQLFAGIEYSLTDNSYLFAKYKYYNVKDGFSMNIKNRWEDYKYDFSLKNNNIINLGFKYIW